MEAFTNWPAVMMEGARGALLDPEPSCKYVAELVLRSGWAEDDFLAVRFPEDHRRFVKLHGHAMIEGIDYVAPLGMDVIGAAVGLGNTLEEAMEMAREVAKSVEGQQITFEDSAFDDLQETIEQGIKTHVPWT